MPVWFQNQLMRAFFQKDLSQIKLLNQFWYYYIHYHRERSKAIVKAHSASSSSRMNH